MGNRPRQHVALSCKVSLCVKKKLPCCKRFELPFEGAKTIQLNSGHQPGLWPSCLIFTYNACLESSNRAPLVVKDAQDGMRPRVSQRQLLFPARGGIRHPTPLVQLEGKRDWHRDRFRVPESWAMPRAARSDICTQGSCSYRRLSIRLHLLQSAKRIFTKRIKYLNWKPFQHIVTKRRTTRRDIDRKIYAYRKGSYSELFA
jgi:hypothetical protein